MQEDSSYETLSCILTAGSTNVDVPLDHLKLAQYADYCLILQEANRHSNLTALKTVDQIAQGLLLPSMEIAGVLPDVFKNGSSMRVIDVGSGAGIPGIPLKILFPSWRLTLIESIGKKARFLDKVVLALDLDNVLVLCERSEIVARSASHRDTTDLCLARAVAPLRTLLELCAPFLDVGGHLVLPKGREWKREVLEAKVAAQALKVRLIESLPTLDFRGNVGALLLYQKVAATPEKYPRNVGVPAKRPIGM